MQPELTDSYSHISRRCNNKRLQNLLDVVHSKSTPPSLQNFSAEPLSDIWHYWTYHKLCLRSQGRTEVATHETITQAHFLLAVRA